MHNVTCVKENATRDRGSAEHETRILEIFLFRACVHVNALQNLEAVEKVSYDG